LNKKTARKGGFNLGMTMLQKRRSIRLRKYDYAQQGLYFVTVCCQNREHRFGHVQNGCMYVNDFGSIASDLWLHTLQRFQLPGHHPFQIMPDHLHAIIELPQSGCRGNPCGCPLKRAPISSCICKRAGASPAPTIGFPILGDVVGAYKSLVTQTCLKKCLERGQVLGRFWQRNYYEHIIRNESNYLRISEYIKNNPMRWNLTEQA
jgi:putative transposase